MADMVADFALRVLEFAIRTLQSIYTPMYEFKYT